MVKEGKYTSFQDMCEREKSAGNSYAGKFLRPGKVPLELALQKARALGVPQEKIEAAEERGMLDGSLEMTYAGAERIYGKVRASLTADEEDVLDSFDEVRDADLIANYLFSVNQDVRDRMKNSENMYRVVLRTGSQKQKSSRIPEKSDQDIVEGPSTNGRYEGALISPSLEGLIANVPREEFTTDTEYQRRLRVLLRKKAERDLFPLFRDDPSEAFAKIDKRSADVENDNVREVYAEARDMYQAYDEMEARGVNPDFVDPQTGEKGVLPSLHQKIALYHILQEKRFGVFDGCGTGKTAIATLAQPLIEEEMKGDLEARVAEGGRDFVRTVVVCPNPAKRAWKKGLIGKVEERYLENISEDDVAVINGGRKSEEFVRELEDKKWIVVNYDQLTTQVNGTGKTLVETLVDMGVDYVISDESHQIKSQRTETKKGRQTHSAAFRDLANSAEYLTLLTGSPIPDTMKDYGVLFHLLHPDKLKDPKDFPKMYEENPRVLYTLFNEKTVRRTSEDINDDLDFDDPVNEVGELTPKQKTLYDHILEWQPSSWLTQARKAVLDPRLVDPEVLQRAGLLGKISAKDSAKYTQLEDLLAGKKGPVANDENFVVFSSMFQEGVTRAGNESLQRKYVELGVDEEFEDLHGLEKRVVATALGQGVTSVDELGKKLVARGQDREEFEAELGYALGNLEGAGHITLDDDQVTVNTRKNGPVNRNRGYFDKLGFDVSLPERLEASLSKKFGRPYKLGVIDGTVTDVEERERIVDEMGKTLDGIVCTTDTGGESLDFTRANHAFFLDRDYKPKTEEQAVARILRKGQKNQVHVTRLLGADTLDEPLEEYVEKKKLIVRTAVDGYHLTDEEREFLEDVEGKKFSEMLRGGLGGKSINTLEAAVDDIGAFNVKKRNRKMKGGVRIFGAEPNTTEAQRLMQMIGQDPVNCWQDPEFAKLYVELLPSLSVPVVHRAKISDLIRRSQDDGLVFPRHVLSDGSGPSLLFEAYQGMAGVITANDLKVPKVIDRDVSKAMLKLGSNPNQVVGNMTGYRSKFRGGQFDMVDNASISLLQNSEEVRKTLLEASRILKKGKGLLELTVDGRNFYDGSPQAEEEVNGKKVRRDFYTGLEQLGFEVLSEKNQGFGVSRAFSKKLKKEHGAHFQEAYERKLDGTRFILARKVDKPADNVDAANFWWSKPEVITPEENREVARDPTESRSIITPGRRRGGRRLKSSGEENFEPQAEVTINRDGTVGSVKKIRRKK